MSHPIYLKPALNYLEKWLDYQKMMDVHVPGFAVAICYNGEIIFERGFGYANLETNEEMTKDYLFRIASHTKTFTATALLQLEEDGFLSIHDKLSQYLPFLLKNKDKRIHDITIHNALAHSAGIRRDGEGDSFWSLFKPFPSKAEIIEFFEDEPLTLNPNEKFKYSNYGYALLGMVIETVSGKSFQDYMIENVISPLKLESIYPAYERGLKNLVTGYSFLPNGDFAPITSHVDTSGVKGATSFCSTASSLAKFYSNLSYGNETIITDASKRKAFKKEWWIEGDPKDTGYGLGFAVIEQEEGRTLYGHGGGMPGNITNSLFDPKEGVSVVVLTNSHRGDPRGMQKGIWQILDFFKENYKKHSDLFAYEGHYFSIWRDMYFTAIDDKLYATSLSAKMPFSLSTVMTYKDKDIFEVTKDHGIGALGEVVTFEKDDTGYYSVFCAALYRMLRKDRFLEHVKKVQAN